MSLVSVNLCLPILRRLALVSIFSDCVYSALFVVLVNYFPLFVFVFPFQCFLFSGCVCVSPFPPLLSLLLVFILPDVNFCLTRVFLCRVVYLHLFLISHLHSDPFLQCLHLPVSIVDVIYSSLLSSFFGVCIPPLVHYPNYFLSSPIPYHFHSNCSFLGVYLPCVYCLCLLCFCPTQCPPASFL